jgi:hypothetical protein
MAEFVGPAMLYLQREGQLLSQTFDEAEAYEAAKAEGWKSSPAEFGIETHPSHPATVMSVEPSATPAMSAAMATEMQAAQSVLLTLQARVDAMSVAIGQLVERLDALEEAVLVMRQAAAGAAAPDDEPAHTRRRAT